jgi:hypothetical protein
VRLVIRGERAGYYFSNWFAGFSGNVGERQIEELEIIIQSRI